MKKVVEKLVDFIKIFVNALAGTLFGHIFTM